MTRLYFAVLLCAASALAACTVTDATPNARETHPARYGLGHVASPAQIASVNVDVNPTGAGLPAGQGTAATGAVVYAQKCAMCHGPHGEGIDKYPKLIGLDPPPGFVFARDPKAPKTIGNYWPYATTLYDYLRRTMPWNAPGSLTSDETYGLVAFLLTENGITLTTPTLDARTLPGIQMPARSHFVPDNRTGGATFR
jgi:cytochrome c